MRNPINSRWRLSTGICDHSGADNFQMRADELRKPIIQILRLLRLNRIASNIYYRFIHGFAPAGAALPDAIDRAFALAASDGLLERSDYCEFGIFKGFTFLHANQRARELGFGDKMRFFGFDSFEGLPATSEADLAENGSEPFYEGQYACSREAVTRELDARGMDWERAHLIEGFFDRSLSSPEVKEHKIRRVAVALVDCDLYTSTLDVLEFLDSRLVDGAIVLMDDWKSYGDDGKSGQPRALRKFLEDSPHWASSPVFDYGHYGRVFRFSHSSSARRD